MDVVAPKHLFAVKNERHMLKAFVFTTLLGGATLFLTALFWPDHSPPAAGRNQHLQPIAADVETREPQSIEMHNRLSDSPPPPATLAMPDQPTAEIPASHRADLQPSATPLSDKPARESTANAPTNLQLTPDEQKTLKQTGTDDTSLRDTDFPRTYISKIHVDLTGPNQWVTLTWSGPNARVHPSTQYHSSPGRGLGYNNCNEPAESCRVDSNCTPKGTMHVQSFSNTMQGSPEVRFVTWFDTKRGIALHYYPFVPNYPASHGCVRLDEYAARLIHNNSKIGETEVVIDGNWNFVR
jgi:lipoprotein-anchoring transpeptidase ErfK/SrfK